MIDNKVEAIRKHLEAIAEILGIEKTESNENTPLRVAKMWTNEVFVNRNNANIEELNAHMKVFEIDGDSKHKYQGRHATPITLETEFYSMCEHHWMPFMGTVTVSYIPNDKIIGLSKIPRVVQHFSKKPQLQERLTDEIGDYLVNIINPRSLTVVIKAKHTCVSARGIEKPCETTTAFSYRGGEGE